MTAPKIFGSEPSTSVHGIESGTVSLIISFFTAVVVNILILTGSDIDVLIYMISILFIWTVLRNIFSTLSDALKTSRVLSYSMAPIEDIEDPTQIGAASKQRYEEETSYITHQEDEGWSDNLRVLLDFISKIVVIMPFQYGSKLIMSEWTTVGVTTQETLILLFIIAVIFFPAYLWIDRSWQAHNAYEKRQFRVLLSTIH